VGEIITHAAPLSQIAWHGDIFSELRRGSARPNQLHIKTAAQNDLG
jgi:hypothetical protein